MDTVRGALSVMCAANFKMGGHTGMITLAEKLAANVGYAPNDHLPNVFFAAAHAGVVEQGRNRLARQIPAPALRRTPRAGRKGRRANSCRGALLYLCDEADGPPLFARYCHRYLKYR